MEKIFLEILNMSLSGSLLILVVLIVRFLLKKAPKWIACVLWGLVAVRLLCPFSIESAISLLPSAKPVPTDIAMMPKPEIDSGIPAINQMVNPVIERSFTPTSVASANPLQIINFIAAWIWIIGIVVLLVYAIVSYGLLYKKVRSSITVEGNVRLCDYIETPFILGVIRPSIYLPSSVSDEQLYHIIAHEKAHLKRLDHIWKPLGFFVLVIHWFNPLVWGSYVLLCKDIEMACDEKVISDLDKKSVASYSQSLLECSVERRNNLVYPLAFGEVSVKERIKHVLNYKRPRFWIICVAIIACIVVAVCFLTNPKHIDVIEEQVEETVKPSNIPGTDTNSDMTYISTDPEDEVLAYYQMLHTIESAMYDASLIEENPEAYKDSDGNEICSSEFFMHLYDGKDDMAYQNLGYAILDIDGNGVEELILGASDPQINGNWNGIIYDLYTFQDDKVDHIFSGWPRNHYRLTNNNEFVCEWSAGADDSGEDYYRFDGETGSLVKIEELAADSIYINLEYIPIGPNWHQINDLNGDGEDDYVIYTGMDGFYNHLALYLKHEGKIFEHVDDNYVEIGGMVSAIDIDHDGDKEIALSMIPHVNSTGLVEYAVLKKEKSGWKEMEIYDAKNGENSFPIHILHIGDYKNVISCDGLEKTIGFDVEYLRNYWENNIEISAEYKAELLSYYESINKSITGIPVGHVCDWGMWDINEAIYNNDVCLQAQFGIAGFDKNDLWGYLSIYFDFDRAGKIRILDIAFDSVKMELPETKNPISQNVENTNGSVEFVERWARAFCFRDGEFLYIHSSENARDYLEITKVKNNYAFGFSSPWPWDDNWIYIKEVTDSHATIYYYALTSVPHVSVWQQHISYEKDSSTGDYVVKTVNTEEYDNIVLGSKFDQAYSGGLLWMDYTTNSLGEALNKHAVTSSTNLYKDLFQPDTAARRLLNLLPNENKIPIEIQNGENENEKILKITFMEDNQTRTIKMVQPWGGKGIWVPQAYEDEGMTAM